jgi:excinuclease ABC subunit C
MGDTREHVDRQRAQLPGEPGVYVYTDTAGNVLYVGKAKNLKKRVNSYFTKSHDAKTHALVMRIANIEVFAVGSESEALVFEQNLVKRHRPPFNVMLRDDKSYPFIKITLGDEYPRVLFTREKHRPGTRYFGPYSNARRVRQTLDLLNRIFPYRPCEGPQPGRQSGVPCLDYHIERCAAPCVGYISREDYRGVIEQVMQVLAGKATAVRKSLTAQMQAASAELEFERAARVRNRIAMLTQVMELQAVERPGQGSFDIIAAAAGEGDVANVQLLQVRDGHMADRRSMFVEQVEGLPLSTVLAQFCLSYYQPGRPVPAQVVVPHGAMEEADRAMLEAELELVRGAGVEVRPAQRGDKRRLAEMAERNAGHAIRYDSIRERQRIERRALAMEELRDELDLESLPLRVECYDISNLQERAPVASMVVFEDGVPKKAHYRKFAMRHAHGQDDFAMMAEVIKRRFARLADDEPELAPDHEIVDAAAAEPARNDQPPDDDVTSDPDDSADASFSSFPNLVIIDGGKGQLNAAVGALRELGIERVSVCSLAKREEEVFLPRRPHPIVLDQRSAASLLLQRVRNEAHRFALGYHRTKRSMEAHASVLDTLEGVGPARRRALLNFFGSPEKVMAATIDELESVPGLPGKVARRVYDQLHRLGGSSGGMATPDTKA